MNKNKKERRQHKRFHSDVQVHFDFVYDLETKVRYEFVGGKDKKKMPKKYKAVSRNISVGGICLISHQKTKQDDKVHLEVYLPNSEEVVHMEGRVEWCKPVIHSYEDRLLEEVEGKPVFEIGIRILTVNGQPINETIHHDQVYDVDWSIVLDSVFGSYRMLMEGGYRSQKG